jgi:hypothetical protein
VRHSQPPAARDADASVTPTHSASVTPMMSASAKRYLEAAEPDLPVVSAKINSSRPGWIEDQLRHLLCPTASPGAILTCRRW